ncbi:uncharacterized protein LOC114828045, partial [Galendromus occidentalis]|uniref:Uncharacterized protein LOC114828045 n=1 Tax=Galendromus occidentalis TaxID=34638 RepID=A0AAJ7SD60_9ACAR
VSYKLYADDLKVFCRLTPETSVLLQRTVDGVSHWCYLNDLGVTITPTLDFSAHIADTLLIASRLTGTIMRSFIVRDPTFYIHLYRSLILPRLTYCCEIWRPYLKKEIKALDRLQNSFIRRVAYRCDVDRETIALESQS